MSRVACRLSFFALFSIAACECAPQGTPRRPCTTASECEDGERCIDSTCVPASDGGTLGGHDAGVVGPAPVSVRIEPASADLVSIDGARPMQDFAAIITYADGSEREAPSDWSIDTLEMGDIDSGTGLFTANGLIGGTGTVTVSVPVGAGAPLAAVAPIRVRLERTLPGAVPAETIALFGTAARSMEPTRAASLVYPLDRAVMPQNVYPADIQWTVGAPGDFFRVALAKPSVNVYAYVAYDGLNHWLADLDSWRALARTEPDMPATILVDRLEAATGELVLGSPINVRFARAALTGSVYYWDIEAGRIQRIDDGAGTAVSFMPNPQLGCVGCHSVSPSGRYMAGRLGGGENTGTVYDLTTDLTGNPPPTVFPVGSLYWWFSSWSPDESRLVVSADEGGSRSLRIYDPMGGASVGITGSLPTNATHPAWSPDGTRIAYVGDLNSWGGDFTAGNLYTLPVTGPDTFGAPALFHSATSIGGSADSYPSWSPDSMRVAFGNGTGCRSERDSSSLYVANGDGSDVRRLSLASSAGNDDFQPRFSPFTQGGYYWLSFLSRRVYGNDAIGNGPRPVNRRQQIWVAAIRTDAAPGEDPSAVPYWLPGQNPRSANISAYWAPRACRVDGEACTVGSECCGGDCRPDATGALVCSPPPMERCRMEGETCSTDADCCADMDLTCFAHVCIRPLM